MDPSLTGTQFRCLWNIIKFWGREVFCPRFTNMHGFLLAFSGYHLTSYLSGSYTCCIPSYLINFGYVFSIVTMCLEGVGLVSRIIWHYDLFFRRSCTGIPHETDNHRSM